MKENEDILWIFLHIPKCAGSTFRYHVLRNFNREEVLDFPRDLKLNTKRPVSDRTYFKKATLKLLSDLEEETKEKIKVICGHWIPYGIHEHFDKIPRYVVFVRRPIDRVISSYNFLSTHYHNKSLAKYSLYNLEGQILKKGRLISFERWLETMFDCTNQPRTAITMTRFLVELGYLNREDKESLKNCLNKFYFVGITELFDNDAFFLYHKMGINKFYRDQNISNKYFDIEKLNKVIKSKIQLKIKQDQTLYDYALERNKTIKKTNKNYYNIVKRMRVKRKLIFPFTQYLDGSLQYAYKVSSSLKKHSSLYSKFIGLVK